MKKMFAVLVAAVLVLGLGAGTAQATILNFNDAYYIGRINDGNPSNLSDTAGYINHLISLAPGAVEVTIGTETYDRVGSTLNMVFPAATATGGFKLDTSVGTGINVTGWTYLLGKYDAQNAGAYVWYVAGLTTVDIPATAGQYGLSHYTKLNFTAVPDGGMTLMLLGGALVGLGALRRRFRA